MFGLFFIYQMNHDDITISVVLYVIIIIIIFIIMEKDRIEALHQYQDPLIQKASKLVSLASAEFREILLPMSLRR